MKKLFAAEVIRHSFVTGNDCARQRRKWRGEEEILLTPISHRYGDDDDIICRHTYRLSLSLM